MKKQENKNNICLFEYYNRAFSYLHDELEESGYDKCSYHPIRNDFWKEFPESTHSSANGIKFVSQYLELLK